MGVTGGGFIVIQLCKHRVVALVVASSPGHTHLSMFSACNIEKWVKGWGRGYINYIVVQHMLDRQLDCTRD